MIVTIVPVIDHEEYEVNGKTVYKYGSHDWVCKVQMTSEELTAFEVYRKNVINNKAFKRHTKATYGKK